MRESSSPLHPGAIGSATGPDTVDKALLLADGAELQLNAAALSDSQVQKRPLARCGRYLRRSWEKDIVCSRKKKVIEAGAIQPADGGHLAALAER